MRRFIYYVISVLLFTLILIFTLWSFSFASYPKLVSKIIDVFEDIQSYLVAIATPVAAVTIASGFLMQKFSFGDEERIRTGKKLIRISIISYAFILVLDMIISLIETLVG